MTVMRIIGVTLLVGMLASACATAQVPPPGGPPGPDGPPFGPPPAPPAGQTTPTGYGSLVQAYRDISNARQFGGDSTYVQQARSHYAQALSRFRQGDRSGALGQGRTASDLPKRR